MQSCVDCNVLQNSMSCTCTYGHVRTLVTTTCGSNNWCMYVLVLVLMEELR